MIEVYNLKRNEEKEWDEYVKSHKLSTFYHQIGWKNVVKKTYGHKPIYLVAKLDGEIKGVLPLFLLKSKIFGKKLISLPFAPYGGVCASNDLVEEALIKEAKEITKEVDADYLEIRDLYGRNYNSFITKSDYVTSILELDPNPEVVWRERFKKNKRKMITRSKKQNLTFSWTDKVDNFYKLFSRNMRDLGSPVHSKDFFKNILAEFPSDSRILEVKRGEEVIYAAFYLFYKERMINSWSSTLKKYRKYLPTDFGIWNAIKYGCENGFKYYDFGRSQRGSSNFEFKRRWGAKAIPLNYTYYLNGAKKAPDLTLNNPKRRRFSMIWRKLPLPLANLIGPYLRGVIS